MLRSILFLVVGFILGLHSYYYPQDGFGIYFDNLGGYHINLN